MKLEFKLLIVDDQPDSIGEAVGILSDHLETKGFTLEEIYADDYSKSGIQQLTRNQGKDYDLVIVDYRLGSDIIDGAIAASQLRRDLRYTDMVFYSSDSSVELHAELARESVTGVFVETRDNLSDALTGLADTVIGKAVDLDHMRGIAMAEVAEMDVTMEETLRSAIQAADDQWDNVKDRTIEKLKESMTKNDERLSEYLSNGGLAEVVIDGRLFTSVHKIRAIIRFAGRLPNTPSLELAVLSRYQNEVIVNRNLLAHSKEYTNDAGDRILRSIKREEAETIIDESWMDGFRNTLREHRNALSVVCDSIDRHFNTLEPTSDI